MPCFLVLVHPASVSTIFDFFMPINSSLPDDAVQWHHFYFTRLFRMDHVIVSRIAPRDGLICFSLDADAHARMAVSLGPLIELNFYPNTDLIFLSVLKVANGDNDEQKHNLSAVSCHRAMLREILMSQWRRAPSTTVMMGTSSAESFVSEHFVLSNCKLTPTSPFCDTRVWFLIDLSSLSMLSQEQDVQWGKAANLKSS